MGEYRIVANDRIAGRADFPFGAVMSEERAAEALREISRCPLYRPTPLHRLTGMARACGVAELLYKDEGDRFGLGSFKALGGAYAVADVLRQRVEAELGHEVSIAALARGEFRESTKRMTVACATDGNHGRAIAAGAQVFGCEAVVFLHENVSADREERIASYGARIIRRPGDYDASVAAARRVAEEQGWIIVSDTSWPGYEAIPARVMQGYAVMAIEIFADLEAGGGDLPTHIFLQGGVGGLAASVVGYLAQRLGARAPRFVVVEPERADCLYQSALAGTATPSSGDLNTIMAGLACGEVSPVAWEILQAGADYFMTVSDAAAVEVMRLLARGAPGDAPIVAGESAVAGLAAVLALDEDGRRAIGLDEGSRVLVFGTEGATDPVLYRQLVGIAA